MLIVFSITIVNNDVKARMGYEYLESSYYEADIDVKYCNECWDECEDYDAPYGYCNECLDECDGYEDEYRYREYPE